MKCSICGASLSYSRNAGKYPYFVCYRYAKGFHKGSSAIAEKRLIRSVSEYLNKLLNGQDFTLSYIEHTAPELTALEQCQKELDNLSIREQRIKMAYETGVDTLEEYKENKTRLSLERERLKKQFSRLQDTPAAPDTKESFLKKVQTVYDVIENPEIENDTKGVFIRSIVEEIIYDKEKDSLTFRLYSPKTPLK